MATNKSLLIDCERMKYLHTGLYHFCLHLGKSLLRTNIEKRKFCFFVPPKLEKPFGDNCCYIQQHPLQKVLLPSTRNVELWHSTHQAARYYPWRRKLKVVLTVHDLNFIHNEDKRGSKKAKYVKELAAKIHRTDAVVAISDYTLNDLKQHIDLKDKAHYVIYNGSNIAEIQQLNKPALLPTTSFLFTIGTITKKKNFHVLPALLAKNDLQLFIAGITQSKAYKNFIMQEAKKWGVADRVFFTGAISENDKQWYLKHCIAFLFPSVSEGFGMPVIEAMHFGIPVILSNHTSLPEVGGTAAYYFRNFEPEGMQQTLADSLNNYRIIDRKKSIQERASLFNWEKTAREYHAVYNSLLSTT